MSRNSTDYSQALVGAGLRNGPNRMDNRIQRGADERGHFSLVSHFMRVFPVISGTMMLICSKSWLAPTGTAVLLAVATLLALRGYGRETDCKRGRLSGVEERANVRVPYRPQRRRQRPSRPPHHAGPRTGHASQRRAPAASGGR
jgi:hypothetical protein